MMDAVIAGVAENTMMGVEPNKPNIKEYDTKIDSKKRITLRGSRFEYYHVMEFPNGKIELQPRELREPFEISKNSLHMMDLSMENLKNGISGEPLDFSQYDFIDNLPDDDTVGTDNGQCVE